MRRSLSLLPALIALPLIGQTDCAPEPAQQPIVFHLVGTYSGAPVPGVSIWLGVDGLGPVGISDAQGEVRFMVEDPVQDWSVGYVSPNGNLQISTTLGDDLSEERTVFITHLEPVPPPDRPIAGDILGADPSGGDTLWLSAGGVYSELPAPITQRMPYLISASDPDLPFLFAAQASRSTGLPERFGMALNPPDNVDIPLSETLDGEARFIVEDTMSDAEYAYPTLYLSYGGAVVDIFLDGHFFDDPDALTLPIPRFEGVLEAVRVDGHLSIVSADGRASQFAHAIDLAEGDPHIPLPSPHTTDLPPGFTLADLPGARLPISRRGDESSGAFAEVFAGPDGQMLRQIWVVRDLESKHTLQIPLIPPATGLTWPTPAVAALPASDLLDVYAETFVFDLGDRDDAYQGTSARLYVVSSAQARSEGRMPPPALKDPGAERLLRSARIPHGATPGL